MRPVARPWTQWVKQLAVWLIIRTYVYVCILCCVIHILCTRMRNKHRCQDHKSTLQLRNALYNTTRSFLHVHTFLKIICLQPWWFNRRNTWIRQGVARVLAGWSAFVFDILHTPSGCVQICWGCVTPTYNPWLRVCVRCVISLCPGVCTLF